MVAGGIIDYGTVLRRVEILTSVAREAARTTAAYSMADDLPGVPIASKRSCSGTMRSLDKVFCNVPASLDFNVDCSTDHSLECLAAETAKLYLSQSKLNPDEWLIKADTCIVDEPQPSPGSTPSPLATNAIRVRVERVPGIKSCIWCNLDALGIKFEHASSVFKLEGLCG